ncbi:hypothetical protein O9K51_08767 [Purpureocillium lavendulum]|uniref:Uncharacterized protein n=1 Tax=Purpureocillium lavendulum TaxID=1247861 RepID=A0AB34FIF2_9HYPO|nr:hypothetical protein O9K51_08767 [Purpureocillium lavendulum]
MAFLEDPRLRQRWNQIAHDAEAVTENAAAGIWSFQHNYINPCFGSVADSIERCTTLCLGDPEERLRRRRERERTHGAAEYSFDFYDDWYEEENAGGGGGGLLGSWGGEDWDRLLAGTGSARKHAGGETTEQPRRKRGMSYGTRGPRRKTTEQDPTIIPSTQPIGFLSKLPWKMGGTLRYKPSAADLQEHPGKHDHAAHGLAETEPLLGPDADEDYRPLHVPRQRSGTTGSGGTSDSYRSRGDLFPSDGEGDEDAIPLDDEVTYDMIRKDDRSSGKTSRTRSSKGKRPAEGLAASRTVSRTTLGSSVSGESPGMDRTMRSLPLTPDAEHVPSLEDLEREEERLRQEEEEELARRKEAATQLAAQKGLRSDSGAQPGPGTKAESTGHEEEDPEPAFAGHPSAHMIRPNRDDEPRTRPDEPPPPAGDDVGQPLEDTKHPHEPTFFAARLPNFG